jgi:hypothetical protein
MNPLVQISERIKVIEALETGISIDAPSGKVTINPPSHHCVLDVHIAEVSDRKLKVLEELSRSPQILPRYLRAKADGRFVFVCVYRKSKPGRSGDGVRLEWGTRCPPAR